MLTYPRTDSRALPEDYLSTVQDTLGILRDESSERLSEITGGSGGNPIGPHAATILSNDWVKPNKRILMMPRFLIISPLFRHCRPRRNLSEAEAKVYDLVVRRFMAVFFPPAEFRNTTRISQIDAHHFKTEGKVMVKPGWLAIYGREAIAGEGTLVAVGEHENPRLAISKFATWQLDHQPDIPKLPCFLLWKAQAN